MHPFLAFIFSCFVAVVVFLFALLLLLLRFPCFLSREGEKSKDQRTLPLLRFVTLFSFFLFLSSLSSLLSLLLLRIRILFSTFMSKKAMTLDKKAKTKDFFLEEEKTLLFQSLSLFFLVSVILASCFQERDHH